MAPYFQRFRRQLEGDLLELRVAPGDVAVLALDQLLLDLELSCLLLDALEHLRGQRRDGLGRQTLQVLSLEIAHAEHASHLAKTHGLTPLEELLSTRSRVSRASADAHSRVITLISGRRCQGRPTIKASNCVLVNDSG